MQLVLIAFDFTSECCMWMPIKCIEDIGKSTITNDQISFAYKVSLIEKFLAVKIFHGCLGQRKQIKLITKFFHHEKLLGDGSAVALCGYIYP